MTVQELIDDLQKIENKNTKVLGWDEPEYGYCEVVCTSLVKGVLSIDFYQLILSNSVSL